MITVQEVSRLTGVRNMDFTAFDTKKIDEYSKQAKENWGHTDAWKEYEQKEKDRTPKDQQDINVRFMKIFEEFGTLMDYDAGDAIVQQQVKKLKDFITDHFYTCTNEILSGLAKMYAGGGPMTENIDKASKPGTACFAAEAVEIFCKNKK